MATAGEVYTSPSVSQELHVLAVDDSLVDRKVIERLLKLSCCKVTAVESGTRALQYLGLDGENGSSDFDALKVNLIMTDYSMPGMTGYELLKKIKESSAFREIPVVIMSSENILARIDRCLEEGAEEYIVKPVKLSDVRRIKEAVINGEGEENGKTKLPKRKQMDDIQPLPSPSTPLSFSPSGACDDASSSQASSSASSPVSSPKRLPSSPSSPIGSSVRLPYSPSSPVSLSMQPPSSPPSSLSPLKRPKLHTRD